MVKDPICKNRNWKTENLEPRVEEKIRELLCSPKMVEELMTARKPKAQIPIK